MKRTDLHGWSQGRKTVFSEEEIMKKSIDPILILYIIAATFGYLTSCSTPGSGGMPNAREPLIFSAIDPQTPTEYPGFFRCSPADIVWAKRILDENPQAVNAKDAEGNTPLMRWVMSVCAAPDCHVGQFLVERGANLDATNKKGETALMIAARLSFAAAKANGNKLNKINFLITNGANVNLRSKKGETALTYAQVQCQAVLQGFAPNEMDPHLRRELSDECTQAAMAIGRAGGTR